MENLTQQELLELKRFFKQGEEYLIFEILFVLESVKPGVFIHTLSRQRADSLANMLRWFNLYVNTRSIPDIGLDKVIWRRKISTIWFNLRAKRIYATTDRNLYKDWNRFFLRESYYSKNASRFLGYPQCCVDHSYNASFQFNTHFHLYSLVKDIRFGRKTIQHLQEFMINCRFITYMTCSIYCPNSLRNARNYDLVIKKYKWLVGDLLEKYFDSNVKSWIFDLASLAEINKKPDIYTRLVNLLINRDLVRKDGLNPDDITELVRNPSEARKNIAYGIRLLRANWKCMFAGL